MGNSSVNYLKELLDTRDMFVKGSNAKDDDRDLDLDVAGDRLRKALDKV